MSDNSEKKKSMIRNILYHLMTFIIIIYGVLNKSILYFLTAYITVIISILLTIGVKYSEEIGIEKVVINLYDTSIISTILSTLVCFLVSLYFMINKPDKNNSFVNILWFSVIIAVAFFTITAIELVIQKNLVNIDLKFYITYALLFLSFIFTIYIKTEVRDLKKKYMNQLISIESYFMNESSYNGKALKV